MTQKQAQKPNGWRDFRLDELVSEPKSDIVDGPFGSNLKASEYTESGVPIARLQNVDANIFVRKNIHFISAEKAAELLRHNFQAGDLLITKLGDPLGEACIVPAEIERGVIVADLVRVRLDPKRCIKAAVCYAINSTLAQAQFKAETKGTTRPRVNLGMVRGLRLRLPEKLDEQKRIVAEIEKQFTRLEAGVASLKRVQAALKRYRGSMLKAACEGRLVPTEAELAKKEKRSYESADILLRRIVRERRDGWNGKGKYKEPVTPKTEQLPSLPEGWAWAAVEQLSNVVRGASPRPAGDPRYFGGTIPWITVGPIAADHAPFLKAVPDTVTEAGRERSRFIEPHTLLLTNSGATLGVPKISLIGGCINDGVAALLDVEYPLKLYLLYFLHTQTKSLRGVNQGAAQPNLNTTIIKAINVPLPPLAEQKRIVVELEKELSVVDELETVATTNLQRARRLRQAILQQAFSGGLAMTSGADSL
jgi:type I restriction enzyme S subunit